MILLTPNSKVLLEDIIDKIKKDHENRYPTDVEIWGNVDAPTVLTELQKSFQTWNHGVWSAVELDVGYRLPNELKDGDTYQGNCGEKAGFLYAAARLLDVDELRFYLRGSSQERPEITHAFITFEAEGETWIADPVEVVTNEFEIKKDAILIDGKRIPHYGVTRLSEEKLDRFIRKLRKPGSIIELFEGKQLLVDAKDENEEDIYVTLHKQGHPQLKSSGPVLEVTCVYDEPFHTNSVVQLLYPVFFTHQQPTVINLFDSTSSDWYSFEGTHIGTVFHPGSHDEAHVFRSIEDGFDDTQIQGILAYNEYQRRCDEKIAQMKRRKDQEQVYIAPPRRRAIVARLQERRERLMRTGKQKKKVEKLAKEEQSWMAYLTEHTHQYAERYMDFCVAVYWRFKKKDTDTLLEPFKTQYSWETKIMEEYAGYKHLRRLQQTIERHDHKIEIVRSKIRTAYSNR